MGILTTRRRHSTQSYLEKQSDGGVSTQEKKITSAAQMTQRQSDPFKFSLEHD